jgi:hypothetical protein
LPLPDLSFRKNVTVIGIIGNTQGVNIAANPAKNAIANTHHIDSPLPSVVVAVSADGVGESPPFCVGATVTACFAVSVLVDELSLLIDVVSDFVAATVSVFVASESVFGGCGATSCFG